MRNPFRGRSVDSVTARLTTVLDDLSAVADMHSAAVDHHMEQAEYHAGRKGFHQAEEERAERIHGKISELLK